MNVLPIKDVIEIYESNGTGQDIAKQYNVHQVTVSNIKRGATNSERMEESELYQAILEERRTLRRHERAREACMRSMVRDIDRGFHKSAVHSRAQIEGLEIMINECEVIINRLWGEL